MKVRLMDVLISRMEQMKLSDDQKTSVQLLVNRLKTFGFRQPDNYITNLGPYTMWNAFLKLLLMEPVLLKLIATVLSDKTEVTKKLPEFFTQDQVDSKFWSSVLQS